MDVSSLAWCAPVINSVFAVSLVLRVTVNMFMATPW